MRRCKTRPDSDIWIYECKCGVIGKISKKGIKDPDDFYDCELGSGIEWDEIPFVEQISNLINILGKIDA
jgi:hypothetical protein